MAMNAEQKKRWLVGYGYWEAFKRNYGESDWHDMPIEDWLEVSTDNLINDAFEWIDTPEGEDFWSEADHRFVSLYSEEEDIENIQKRLLGEVKDTKRSLKRARDAYAEAVRKAKGGGCSDWEIINT